MKHIKFIVTLCHNVEMRVTVRVTLITAAHITYL